MLFRSTQTCHDCGFIMGSGNTKKLTLKDREWTCPACQTNHIRDVNAAKNILDKGLKQLEKAWLSRLGTFGNLRS